MKTTRLGRLGDWIHRHPCLTGIYAGLIYAAFVIGCWGVLVYRVLYVWAP